MFGKNFLFVSGINFLILIPHYLLFVISAPYAAERFGASASTGGLAAGIMIIGVLVGRFFSGRMIGVIGSKKLLFFGLVEFILIIALYLAANSLPLLMAVRFLSGIGVGCVGTVTGTLIVHITPPEHMGAGISYFSLSTILSMAMGPFLGVLFLGSMSFSWIFLFCCGVGVICLACSLLLTASIPPDPKAVNTSTAFSLSGYIDRDALPISLVILLVAQGYGCIQAFIAFHAEAADLTGAAGVFFPAYAAVALLTRPFTGRLVDKRGENVVAYPTLAALILGLILLGCANSVLIFLLSAAFIGCGFGNFQSTCQIVSVKAVAKNRVAQGNSTFFIFLELGVGFGPYLWGRIVPLSGYNGLFYVLAAVTLAAIPLYFFLHGRKAATPGRR